MFFITEDNALVVSNAQAPLDERPAPWRDGRNQLEGARFNRVDTLLAKSPPRFPLMGRCVALFVTLQLCACGALPDHNAAPITAAPSVAFFNGPIFTANAKQPWADTLIVRGPNIMFVGQQADAQALIDSAQQRVDLEGKLLLPGFHDVHMHAETAGVFVYACNLYGIDSKDAFTRRLSKCIERSPHESWIVGEGWPPAEPEKLLMRKELDKLLPDRPMWLMALDGHNALVNSKALEICGITAQTPNPVAGVIGHYPDGEPSGLLIESAMWLPSEHMPAVSPARRVAALKAAMREANRYGITTIVEAWETPDLDQAWLTLKAAGDLTTRVNLAFLVEEDWDEDIDELKRRRAQMTDEPLIFANQIKLLTDGVVEIQTAAVKQPYPAQKDHPNGLMYFTDEQLNSWIPLLEAAGFQIHAHTIGDLAMDKVLTGLEHSRRVNDAPNNRPMFIHNYLVDPDDYARLKAAGASANFTMLWRQIDPNMQVVQTLLEQAQFERVMPMADLHEQGILVTGASDFYVSQIDPLASVVAGVTGKAVPYYRSQPYQPDSQPVMPGRKPNVETMIKAYTIYAARAQGIDALTGSLEAGKRADITLMDRNFFEGPVENIYGTRALMTMMDGQVVFTREQTP